MQQRVVRRAAFAAMTALLMTATSVFADMVPADGDAAKVGSQSSVDLGKAFTGQVITRSVSFELLCANGTHVAGGSTIQVDLGDTTVPDDGTVTATPAFIPVPAGWTDASGNCASPTTTARSTAPSVVTLTMPTIKGDNDQFVLFWDRVPGAGTTGLTAVTFEVDVIPNTPPHLILPADQTLEATSSAGAVATFAVTATDVEDSPAPTPTCDHDSGETFAIQTTTVTCRVIDAGGLSARGSFDITVADTTAPVLSGVPDNQSLLTNDPSGTTLTYTTPTATDAVDPSPDVACVPASGKPIGLSTTTVTCTATDATRNHSEATFDVDVRLNTAPHVTVPSNMTVAATSAAGAVATFSATATDTEDATAPTPSCTPASGSTFAIGTTTVACTVTDGNGLGDSGSFTVTVADNTAPTLVGTPADIALTTADPTGATLTYTAPTATDAVDPSPTVVCVPASGTKIPVGSTPVTCTATDATGNHASSSFRATVGLVLSFALSAVWGEPVGFGVDTFVANGGRNLPIKVQLFANGVERTRGRAQLLVATCGGAAAWSGPLSWDGSRWTGHLDTSWLAGVGCYRVTAALEGNAAGSFRLDLRGGLGAQSTKPAPGKTKP